MPTKQAARRRKADHEEEGAPASPETEAVGEAPPAPEVGEAPEKHEAAPPKVEETRSPDDEKRRLREQLESLKRREAAIRRELAMADHPTLAEALRAIDASASELTRLEAKRAQGLSKSEERRKETVEAKLTTMRARRAQLDLQIAELEAEIAPLGEARALAFAEEQKTALTKLTDLLAHHEPALAAAGLDVASLVPGISAWRAGIDDSDRGPKV